MLISDLNLIKTDIDVLLAFTLPCLPDVIEREQLDRKQREKERQKDRQGLNGNLFCFFKA